MPHVLPAVTPTPAAVTGQVVATAPAKHGGGFSFNDFLDIINPLQHIPVVSTLYREITGDTMKPLASIVGGALFGGVAGFVGAAVDAIVQDATGEDIGTHVMATLGLHHDKETVAEAQPAAAQPMPAQVESASVPAPTPAKAVPVPAFLVAEAASDRAAHPGSIGPAGTVDAPSSELWRSLQKGGAGTTRAARPAALAIPPGILMDKDAAGAKSKGNPTAAKSATATDGTQRLTASAAPPVYPAANDAPSQPKFGPTAPVQNSPESPQPLPSQAIPEMMMRALSKYEAMRKAPQASSVDQTH